jgi:hypothetical protein
VVHVVTSGTDDDHARRCLALGADLRGHALQVVGVVGDCVDVLDDGHADLARVDVGAQRPDVVALHVE